MTVKTRQSQRLSDAISDATTAIAYHEKACSGLFPDSNAWPETIVYHKRELAHWRKELERLTTMKGVRET